MGKKDAQEAKRIDFLTYDNYYKRLRLLAISRFEWLNLPDTMDERFLETVLCDDGGAIFVNDPILGFLSLRINIAGSLNIYNNPVKYQAWSLGYSKIFNPAPGKRECVRVRNNYIDEPTDPILQMFAKRVADTQRTCDVNVNAQKTPVLIVGTDNQRLTMENVYAQYEGNHPAIFGFKGMIPEALQVLKTDAPYVADKLQDYKDKIMNEAISVLGINTNPNPNKKERQITDEVQSNNDLTDLYGVSALLSRKLACNQFNTMFPGHNIDVQFRKKEDIEMLVDNPEGDVD